MTSIKIVTVAFTLGLSFHLTLMDSVLGPSVSMAQTQPDEKSIESPQRLHDLGFQPKPKRRYRDLIIQSQQKFKNLGFYDSFIDGIVGPKTKSAIAKFQQELDVPITGELDRETARILARTTLIFNPQELLSPIFQGGHFV